MSRTMPRQKPGKSETIVETPWSFVRKVCRYLKIDEFTIDLAALPDNTKADIFVDASYEDSLKLSWHGYLSSRQWAWLNPPYDKIAPWVEKAGQEMLLGASIAMLVPASVGSNWWRDWVHGKALVKLLNGRIQFVGHKTGYPKDLALLLYSPNRDPGYETWRWK